MAPNFFLLLAVLSFACCTLAQKSIIPIPRTHAHNDYLNEMPLEQALSFGFISVEADILLKDNQLFVGHNRSDLFEKPLMNLDETYLQSLYHRYQKHRGRIYPGYSGLFYLWIDIKYDGFEVCRILRQQIEPYLDMIYSPAENPDGPVMLVISGDRPFDFLLNDPGNYLMIDGRPADLEKQYPSSEMSFISQNINSLCSPDAEGLISLHDWQALTELVDRCHRQNKKVRFWATADREEVWSQLLNLQVDLINTDSLGGLSTFLKDK